MKKLLGLLAVAPMALAACGPAAEKEAAETTYFLGHGKYTNANGVSGAQNTNYNLVEAKVFVDGDKISYEINESTGYIQNQNLTGNDAAVTIWSEVLLDEDTFETTPVYTAAKDAWIAAENEANGDDLADEAGFKLTSGSTEEGTYGATITAWITSEQDSSLLGSVIKAAANDVASDDANIDNDTYYTNKGESLRYAYEVVTVDFDRSEDKVWDGEDGSNMIEFINKDTDNYGSGKFDFTMNSDAWEAYLNKEYNTCALLDAVTDTKISDLASDKTAPDYIAGATAGESGLYIAGALATGKAYCAK